MNTETNQRPDYVAVLVAVDISTRPATTFGTPIGQGDTDSYNGCIGVTLDVALEAGEGFALYAYEDAREFCDHESVCRKAYEAYFGK